MNEAPSSRTGVSLLTATAVVVANMIGTGVFTSLGYQVGGLPSGFTIVVLWAVGGLCAFCGALAYGELAAALPRSGGEYHFLSRIYHPAAGFVAGWLSATVGFAAPIALAAMAFGKYYTGIFPGVSAMHLSLGVSVAVTIVHMFGIQVAARFQNLATWGKVALILVFIIAGAVLADGQPVSFAPVEGDGALISSQAFAISLVYVMYSYAGWNAATYIIGEIRDPARNVPRAIALGTGLVTVLYVALNAVFLYAAPISELEGKNEVGHVAADFIFGKLGGNLMSGLICLGLVSSISAMTWVGPRVTMAMGQDLVLLKPFAMKSGRGVPVVALLFQLLIVLALLLTASFESVLNYVQFSIQLCSFATVLGMMILRWRQPNLPRPIRCWGYPLTPLIFLGISLWMLVFVWQQRPVESLAGLGTMLVGLLIYWASPKANKEAV
ncbi:APA family basic amino acid/polyamine antiporter [Prosthecobacter fusiformis]|uniref:APA family basic amino acid/polyamine antiporter n=1 Tax=Prosthecobacter fusiformis TaxID=48464 RepID=A0A4R7RWP5_9BACT|nr:amino acid permease [Prosthecobacter fusiformis]TDU69285.1 APA family basic amino acid/polyamine antiporter [Prosthecobacter fusiformis]